MSKFNLLLYCHIKSFATSSAISANKYSKRESKMLNKIMNGREKGKKVWFIDDGTPLPSAGSLSKQKGQGKEASRRVNVLNKLFMKNISDLIASGEHSEEIIGKGLEISHVKVAPDFQQVNIYWLAKGTDNDNDLEIILKKVAISIRYQLSQLRIMGEVPKLSFHKDKQYAKNAEVDNILIKADFGDDHTPDLGYVIRNELNNVVKLERTNETLLQMRQDVFGLNHSKILEKITKNIRKSKEAWQNYQTPNSTENIETSQLNEINDNLKTMKSSDEFNKFLERKLYKKPTPERKKYNIDKEFILKENDIDLSTFNPKEKDDFILDEEFSPEKK